VTGRLTEITILRIVPQMDALPSSRALLISGFS
jgi:hypothetical protein